MANVSGLIISYNEEPRIAACIESLFEVCSEVVVVDSGSTDDTVRIAREAGAKVYSQSFLGDGPQRNHGLQFCSNDWILNLDADERLTPEAVEVLNTLRDEENLGRYEAYELRRRNFMYGKWIKVAGSYPDWICRFFNQSQTRFSSQKVHTRIESSNTLRIKADILHHQDQGISQIIGRLNLYTTWQAEGLFSRGKSVSVAAPVGHGLSSFFKAYLIQAGFVAGLNGLTLSLLRGLNSYFKYAKLIEMQRAFSNASDRKDSNEHV